MTPNLRRFTVDDWQVYKSIRIGALEADGHFFGARIAIESALTDEQWRERLANEKVAIWGLYDEELCIGLTGAMEMREDTKGALFIASYIRKEYRGKGFSALYYQARLDWARSMGYKFAEVHHRRGNLASKAANQRFGFIYTHTENVPWPDGTQDDSLHYRLDF